MKAAHVLYLILIISTTVPTDSEAQWVPIIIRKYVKGRLEADIASNPVLNKAWRNWENSKLLGKPADVTDMSDFRKKKRAKTKTRAKSTGQLD